MNIRCPEHSEEFLVYLNINPNQQGKNRLLCSLCQEKFLDAGGQRFQLVNLNQVLIVLIQFVQKPFELLFNNEVRRKMFHKDFANYMTYTSIDFPNVLSKAAMDIKKIIDELSIFFQNYINRILEFRQKVFRLEPFVSEQLQFKPIVENLRILQNQLDLAGLNDSNKKIDEMLQTMQLNNNVLIKEQFLDLQKEIDFYKYVDKTFANSELHSMPARIFKILDFVKYKLELDQLDQSKIKSEIINNISQEQQSFFYRTILQRIQEKFAAPTFTQIFKKSFKSYNTLEQLAEAKKPLSLVLLKLSNKSVIGLYSPLLINTNGSDQMEDSNSTFLFSLTNQEFYQLEQNSQTYHLKVFTKWIADNKYSMIFQIGKDLKLTVKQATLGDDISVESVFPQQFSVLQSRYAASKNKSSYFLGSDGEVKVTDMEIFEIK